MLNYRAKPGLKKICILSILFFVVSSQAMAKAGKVAVLPERSIILGQVEKVERDFPRVRLTVKIIKSQGVQNCSSFLTQGQIIQIQPVYMGKFSDLSFFKEKRNLINLQGYYLLPGDFFVAEVGMGGDEKRRGFSYFNIQRINEEILISKVENLEEILRIREIDYQVSEEKQGLGEEKVEEPIKLPREIENLDSLLYRLASTSNPREFAKKHGLYLSEKKVRVIIELAPGCQKVEEIYGMEVEGKAKGLIKAMVPIDQLISLAKNPCVRFVRPPLKPLPLFYPPAEE